MSEWRDRRSPGPDDSPPSTRPTPSPSGDSARRPPNIDTEMPQFSAQRLDESGKASPGSPKKLSRARGDSKPARPNSMMQTHNPHQMEVANDTPPELQPIFSYLNSHSNKLYQEGYFLKLHDLDSRGRPSADRTWTECFAQLIGTVLSLWDAAALDVAGADAEVVPTFVNLSDASIKMIESLPMNGAQGGNLQNVLSVSTAANNRYLLHFNTLNSLTQWTAGIRLAMFEHATLQEAYTGSLIAGKGRLLNNIRQIMFRAQHPYDDWARVRFGAGTPWQRCWMVVSPPDEKEFNKAQKTMKKSSAYERVRLPKGDIKFYDTRKVTKKTRPIATISDAFACYGIYPQSKPLIEQSTLVKLEGLVTLHSSQESSSEGFVFIMPEVHAAVTGFEMMLRFLFPVYDAFGLYGRPGKLVADTLDQRGLMFAMPRDRRYGYLDILDVSSLIHTKGSHQWDERRWRREMKKLTAEKMMHSMESGGDTSRTSSQRRNAASRTSMPSPRSAVRFGDDEGAVSHSTPGSRSASPAGVENRFSRTDSAPPAGAMYSSPHKRSVSEAQGYRRYLADTPSRLSQEASRPNEYDMPPAPPKHRDPFGAPAPPRAQGQYGLERIQSEAEMPSMQSDYDGLQNTAGSPHLIPSEPVTIPPAMQHEANSRPAHTPNAAPELRRAQSNVDAATLYQMQNAVRRDGNEDGDEMWNDTVAYRQQNTVASQSNTNRNLGVPADRSQGAVNRNHRDPRQRLSTIPGSPYIGEDAEYFQWPQQIAVPQMDSVIEEPTRLTSKSASPERRPPPPVPVHSSKSITRKPVPRGLLPPPTALERASSDPGSSASVVNDESWPGGIIDDEALDRVLAASDRQSTMNSATTYSTEPDYASTAESSKASKKSIEKPRTGRLKTVGDPELLAGDSTSGAADQANTWNNDISATDVPNVDFGPTYALTPSPNSRPGTSQTMTPGDKRRSRSADRLSANRLSGMFGQSPRASPNENNRHSYFAGDRATPSPGRTTPEYGAGMGDRSTAAWQPQAQSPARYSRNSMTPEQWVAQRATMAQQPQYAPPKKAYTMIEHGRSNSGQGTRKLTKTPPLGRTLSGDWAQQTGRQTPDRAQSRGAGMNLDSAGASLSAREQMQVSRATGSPLVNLAGSSNKQAVPQTGLMGHVAGRERDRAAAKEGRNSVAVQQAIERQQIIATEAQAQAQQQYEMQMQAAQQAQYQQQQDIERQRYLTAQAHAQAQQQYQMQMQQQQMMSPQNQYPPAYGAQPQYSAQSPRPQVQNRFSWQSASPPQQQPYQSPALQRYGASYLQQQQQQQGRR